MAHQHHHHNAKITNINRSFAIGIGLNLVYVIAEVGYGWRYNSTSLLSDAVHNIGDISGLLLAFLAFRLQRIKSGKIFSYGLRKTSVIASFINSVLLAFAIGAIAWEGIQRILHPEPLNGKVVMAIAGIGVLINFISALLFQKGQKQDLNIKAAYWHLLADALVSLGVVLSGLLIALTGWYMLDGLTAVIIAIVILAGTWGLFKDSAIAMLDGKPQAINQDEIKAHLMSINGVLDVHHIHIWSLSTNETALTAHVVIENVGDMESIKKMIKTELEDHDIGHSTIEIETKTELCQEMHL